MAKLYTVDTDTKSVGVIPLIENSLSPPPGYISVDALAAKWERRPEVKLAEGRKWARDTLYGDEKGTIRVRRLELGLSQAQLAKAIGTQQPHIARIERGAGTINVPTLRKLAEALNWDLNTLDAALRIKEDSNAAQHRKPKAQRR